MEQWYEKVIKSVEGIERATPREGVYEGIDQKIAEGKTAQAGSYIKWQAVAASFLLIMVLNAFIVIKHISSGSKRVQETESYISVSSYNLY